MYYPIHIDKVNRWRYSFTHSCSI